MSREIRSDVSQKFRTEEDSQEDSNRAEENRPTETAEVTESNSHELGIRCISGSGLYCHSFLLCKLSQVQIRNYSQNEKCGKS